MTDYWLLNWAVMAISLFNTAILIWLGLTVALNAERRDWGVWLTAGELLLGGIFFFSHSIILAYGPQFFARSVNIWWQIGWVPVVSSPFAWYVVMLWYAGFWRGSTTRLHRRHWPFFVMASLLLIVVLAMVWFANPLPSISQISTFEISATPSFAGMPVLIWVYPVYIILCLALSLDVLWHPVPSPRVMGDIARKRARPWLAAATFSLLMVSVLVVWVMVWVIRHFQARSYDAGFSLTITLFDLVIAALITVAVLMMGQAMASYEIFTGRLIPRRGLGRLWRRAVILALGYALIMAGSLALFRHPIYSILISAMLIVAFVALLGRRTFDERENLIASLRPFVASQGVFDSLFTKSPQMIDVVTPFKALCEEVLEAQQALLTPLGPLDNLLGKDLSFPAGGVSSQPPQFDEILASPGVIGMPLALVTQGEWMWAVPLWNVSGLVGALYLGAKRDGSLYAQEEIDIARITGERLLDTMASAEITNRLVSLQRQQMAEGQVLDRRTRRILHDEVLPQIHASMVQLSDPSDKGKEVIAALSEVHHRIADLLRDIPTSSAPMLDEWGLISSIRRVAIGEFGEAFDDIAWQVDPAVDQEVQRLAPISTEVVFFATREAIRNAAQHGRLVERPLKLSVSITGQNGLSIVIHDDGIGMRDGPNAGPGRGLALHQTLLAVIGGSLEIESQKGSYTQVTISLPEGRF